jgi:hypothetical protein
MFSDQLEGWFQGEGRKTVGSLIELFGERSFAVVFVLLMAIPALPLPTGGATHVLEVITMLIALQLIVGRRTIWLPKRWCRLQIAGASRERFTSTLLRRIRWLERFARPRLPWLLHHQLSRTVFGLLVLGLSVTAFVAPPFSGLDTLPALGVVVLSLGVLFEDAVIALAGIVIGALGAVLVIGFGSIVVRFVKGLF